MVVAPEGVVIFSFLQKERDKLVYNISYTKNEFISRKRFLQMY